MISLSEFEGKQMASIQTVMAGVEGVVGRGRLPLMAGSSSKVVPGRYLFRRRIAP